MPHSTRNIARTLCLACALLIMLCAAAPAVAGARFRVGVSPALGDAPVSGRLIISLLHVDSPLYRTNSAANAPFLSDPQPIFAADVRDLRPGMEILIADGTCDAFPGPPSALPPGMYRVSAVLDTQQANSDWKREPGNLHSEEYTLHVGRDGAVTDLRIALIRRTAEQPWPRIPGVEQFTVRSRLLSTFRGRDVTLRAGVVFPLDHDPTRQYPAVYVIPGFGGDHRSALREPRLRAGAPPGDLRRALWRRAFVIHLDPEGPNGHHLFANSQNNGPMERALIEELIPVLQDKYNLLETPDARVLSGKSSGGWSALWLLMRHPDVFGAAWSIAPDPLDFRAFQRTDIYADRSMFGDEDNPTPSIVNRSGATLLTVRDEYRMEKVLGPGGTSAQQWDSWQAVFGPR
ncbi:MAG: alpha/beta hydrolase-fold protein, partial [Planctomycetota bacterium]